MVFFKASTLKGLNMKRSNSLREIIATGETCGLWYFSKLQPRRGWIWI